MSLLLALCAVLLFSAWDSRALPSRGLKMCSAGATPKRPVQTIGSGMTTVSPHGALRLMTPPCGVTPRSPALPCADSGLCPFLRFQCSRGHVWKAIPGSPACEACPTCSARERRRPGYRISGLTDCPALDFVLGSRAAAPEKPPSQRRQKSYEKLRGKVEARGGLLVTKLASFAALSQHVEITCAMGHLFEAKAAQVVHQNHWCADCRRAERTQSLTAQVRQAAEANGGELLDAEARGAFVYSRFRCAVGHDFELYPGNLLRKPGQKRKPSFCPQCAADAMKRTVDEVPEGPWSFDVRARERLVARAQDPTQPLPRLRHAASDAAGSALEAFEAADAQPGKVLDAEAGSRCVEDLKRMGLSFTDLEPQVTVPRDEETAPFNWDALEVQELDPNRAPPMVKEAAHMGLQFLQNPDAPFLRLGPRLEHGGVDTAQLEEEEDKAAEQEPTMKVSAGYDLEEGLGLEMEDEEGDDLANVLWSGS